MRQRTLRARLGDHTPSFIYLAALAVIIGGSLYFQRSGAGDDLRRTVAFERIAAALENCGER